MNKFAYGYPLPGSCKLCESPEKCELKVEPHYSSGNPKLNGIKLMLIGQEPTIFKKADRVKEVLMLDRKNGQLSRWLRGVFGENNFKTISLYATNMVKCSFKKPPSTSDKGGLKFLEPFFSNCKVHLINEINNFKPTLVITLGEPAHKLFRGIIDVPDKIPVAMQESFNGSFRKVKIGNVEFDYSPCLHIKTFRVAEVYGDGVKQFKQRLTKYFNDGATDV